MKKYLLAAALALFLILLAGGCSRQGGQENSAAGGSGSVPAGTSDAPAADHGGGGSSGLPAGEPRDAQNTPEMPDLPDSPGGDLPAGEMTTGEMTAPSLGERLAYRGDAVPRPPEDMVIGLLEVFSGPEVSPAIIPAEIFLRELIQGRLARDQVISASQSYIQGLILPIIEGEEKPGSFRLGRPGGLENGLAWVNFRLYGDPGQVFGKIILEETQEGWLITDLQGDLEALDRPYKKEFDLYEPQVYRWLEQY